MKGGERWPVQATALIWTGRTVVVPAHAAEQAGRGGDRGRACGALGMGGPRIGMGGRRVDLRPEHRARVPGSWGGTVRQRDRAGHILFMDVSGVNGRLARRSGPSTPPDAMGTFAVRSRLPTGDLLLGEAREIHWYFWAYFGAVARAPFTRPGRKPSTRSMAESMASRCCSFRSAIGVFRSTPMARDRTGIGVRVIFEWRRPSADCAEDSLVPVAGLSKSSFCPGLTACVICREDGEAPVRTDGPG